MVWITSLADTLILGSLVLLISFVLGVYTAVTAWRSNTRLAFYAPLLTLAVPPWLLSYQLSDTITTQPLLGATLALGICCSVYFHTLIVSGLASSAHKTHDMLVVLRGRGLTTLALSVYPSIRNAFLPASALVLAEVFTDFGVSNFFGINTVLMVAYNVWTSSWNFMSVLPGIAILMCLGILLVVRDNSFIPTSPDEASSGICLYASLAPTATLLVFSTYTSFAWSQGHSAEPLWEEVFNSLYLVALVVSLCLFVSILFIADIGKTLLARIGLFAYALPGVVLASIFLLLPIPMHVALPAAILIRYFGLAVNSLRIADESNSKYAEVVRMFAKNTRVEILFKLRVYRQPASIGMCLVALDVLRELPISMILQPFNFSTLAMRMNYVARTEDISQLGSYSMLLLVLGFILSSTVVFLNVRR